MVGMLAWLQAWWMVRHSLKERNQAKEVTIAFLNKFCSDRIVRAVAASQIPAALKNACPLPAVSVDGCCLHVELLLEKERGLAQEEEPGKCLWELLQFLVMHAMDCPACAGWLRRVPEIITSDFQQKLSQSGSADALKEACFHQTKSGRKRRLDEDYIAALGASAVAGRAGSSMCMARALGDIHPSSASRHNEKFLREYNSSGHLVFANAEACGMTYDAARLGQPPEETVMFMLERLDTNHAMWLPPQAFMGHVQRCLLCLVWVRFP